jgi:hypothetical protein
MIFLQEYDFKWEYVSGPSNRVADALSRHGCSPTHVTWKNLHQLAKNGTTEGAVALNTKMVVEAMEISELASQYDRDPEFKDSFQDPQPPFQKRNGRLYNGILLCLPV